MATGEMEVMKKKAKADAMVRLDAEVASTAKKIAALRDTTVAHYLSTILRPIVARDFGAEVKKLGKGGAE